MAFVTKKKQDETTPTGDSGSSFEVSGGESTGPAAQDQEGAKGTTSQPEGSGWTNLQDYLKVNTGEGQKMADTIIDVKQDERDIDLANASMNVADETAAWNEANQTRDLEADSDYFVDPYSIEQEDFSSYYDQDINPEDENISDDLAAEWRKYEQNAQDVAAVGGAGNAGRQVLLGESEYDRDNYSAGEKGFDAFLMGAGDLQDDGSTTGTTLQSELEDIPLTLGAGLQEAGNVFTSAVDVRDKEVQDSQDAFRKSYQEALANIDTSMVERPEIDPQAWDSYNQLSETPTGGGESDWADSTIVLPDWVDPTSPDFDKTRAQRARYDALGALSGMDAREYDQTVDQAKGQWDLDIEAVKTKRDEDWNTEVQRRQNEAAVAAEERRLAAIRTLEEETRRKQEEARIAANTVYQAT